MRNNKKSQFLSVAEVESKNQWLHLNRLNYGNGMKIEIICNCTQLTNQVVYLIRVLSASYFPFYFWQNSANFKREKNPKQQNEMHRKE